jgi:hypothetical protein
VIPESVTFIGEFAFRNCENLQSVAMMNSIIDISFGMFAGCGNLQSIIIPDGVKTIGAVAFDGCESLQSITIGNGIQSIDSQAFPKEMNVRKWVLAPDSKDEEQCKMLFNAEVRKALLDQFSAEIPTEFFQRWLA